MNYRGDYLRLARQRRGLTQTIASKALGIKQAVLSRMENDLIEVTDEVIEKASSIFDFPADFFEQTEPVLGPPVSVHPMLRGASRLSAKEIDQLTAELNIRMFNLRSFLENVDFTKPLDVPRLDIEQYDSPEDVAKKVRLHWQLTTRPVQNLTRLLERAGVVVGTSEFDGAQISGVTFRPPSSPPIILFNPLHPADRVRFTLAHELGHLVMHRFPTVSMEQEAHRFASEFMLPRDQIQEAFRGRKVTISLLASLKKEWHMSMQAILMAAKSARIITENQAKYLFIQISQKGWRTKEPAELDFPNDLPTVLPDIIKIHRVDLGLRLIDILKITRLNKSEFERLYGPFENSPQPSRPRLRIVN